MDPNWFYSTLAQSAAAVLAIGAGFMVSAALRQRDVAERLRKDLIVKARELSEAQSQFARMLDKWITWYEEVVLPILEQGGSKTIEIVALSDDPERASEHAELIASEYKHRWLQTRTELDRLRSRYGNPRSEKYDQLLRMKRWDRAALPYEIHTVDHGDVFQISYPATPVLNASVKSVRECLNAFFGKLYWYELALDEAEDVVLPQTLRWAVLLLSALAGFGVVLPMSLLTAYAPEQRDALLVIFGLILIATIWLLGLQVVQLRRLVTITREDVVVFGRMQFGDPIPMRPLPQQIVVWAREPYKWPRIRALLRRRLSVGVFKRPR